MTDLDDLPFTHDDGRLPNGATGRRPAKSDDPVKARRGKSARRLGTDQERRIERVYGPTKIGERGDPVDHIGRVWKWQAKATRAAPPLWLARITEPAQVSPVPLTVSIPWGRMEAHYLDRRPVVIRSYVHVGTRTRDWLFVGERDAQDYLGLPFERFGWWVIPGDWWLDHFGRDE